ncbi:hypothetical protein SELMODRAFT_406430 [Selaginella moellendorffii]|uniref:Uncharacterized protein n=1 Tax=Selaginella moellendorffii TaxID=88036 RepID=D8R2C3_SELML|nr:hypothetical protein SELMODRAFT_406430 [Selaginella moellendorffii]
MGPCGRVGIIFFFTNSFRLQRHRLLSREEDWIVQCNHSSSLGRTDDPSHPHGVYKEESNTGTHAGDLKKEWNAWTFSTPSSGGYLLESCFWQRPDRLEMINWKPSN